MPYIYERKIQNPFTFYPNYAIMWMLEEGLIAESELSPLPFPFF